MNEQCIRRRLIAMTVAITVATTAVAPSIVTASPAGGSRAPGPNRISADIVAPASALQGDRFHAWEDSDPTKDVMTVAAPVRTAGAFRPIVAVIDTGIDTKHPMFQDRLLAGQDMIDGDTTPDEVQMGVDTSGNGINDQAFGHGTHIAGIVAQMAPNAWILPYRVLDSDGVGDATTAAAAMDAAVAAGASIVNLSFGTDESTQVAPLDAAIARAVAAGVTVVAAAGNRPNAKLRYPAALPGVIAVTASDGAGTLAPFAAYGTKWVDFAAPGISVLSAVPGGKQGRWSGSSMAAAVASGIAASKLTAARGFKWSMLSGTIGGTLPDLVQTGWVNGSKLSSLRFSAVPPVPVPTTTVPATTVPATTVPTTTVPATTVPAPATTAPRTTVPATTVPATTVPAPTTTAPKTLLGVSGCANTLLFVLAWLRIC